MIAYLVYSLHVGIYIHPYIHTSIHPSIHIYSIEMHINIIVNMVYIGNRMNIFFFIWMGVLHQPTLAGWNLAKQCPQTQDSFPIENRNMYMYIYTYTYTYTYTYIYIYIYIYIYLSSIHLSLKNIYTCAGTDTYTYIFNYVYIRIAHNNVSGSLRRSSPPRRPVAFHRERRAEGPVRWVPDHWR